MTTPRRSNSTSFNIVPDPATPGVAPSNPSQDDEGIEVLLPAPTAPPFALAPYEHSVGQHANTAAAAHLLLDYISGLSVASRRQLGIILKKWCAFLVVVGIERTPEQLRGDPSAWGFVSWGLVQAYVKALLNEGYATSSINQHLAMLRALIYLAHQAGGIESDTEIQRIRTLKGYGSVAVRTSMNSGCRTRFLLILGIKKKRGSRCRAKMPTA
jgi:hypothetical protein